MLSGQYGSKSCINSHILMFKQQKTDVIATQAWNQRKVRTEYKASITQLQIRRCFVRLTKPINVKTAMENVDVKQTIS